MHQLTVDTDGIVFGYTRKASLSYPEGGRTYKSMNYHRVAYKRDKTIWAATISRSQEADFFDASDFKGWRSNRGDHWWVAQDADLPVGQAGERIAFFPFCANHPGPWHGYPVSPRVNSDYEIPADLVDLWEQQKLINDIVAKRMRRGAI